MGDTTSCRLAISGVLHTPAEVERLRAVLLEACGPIEHPLFTSTDLTAGAHPWEAFAFEQVRDGEMPDEVHDVLQQLALDYAWCWDRGDFFDAGVEIGSWAPNFRARETTVDGGLFVPLEDIGKADRIAELQAFDARWETIVQNDVVYAPSAHALLAHFANGAEALARWQEHKEIWSDDEEDA